MKRWIVFVVLLMMPVSVYAMSQMPSSTREMTVGHPAAAFILETTERRQLSLTEALAGQRAIMLFWATWCPHCHEELEKIRLFAARLKEMGIGVVLVNVGETREDAKSFLMRQQVVHESFVDEDNTVAGQYGVTGLPTVFFIDSKGIVREVKHGFDLDILEKTAF